MPSKDVAGYRENTPNYDSRSYRHPSRVYSPLHEYARGYRSRYRGGYSADKTEHRGECESCRISSGP